MRSFGLAISTGSWTPRQTFSAPGVQHRGNQYRMGQKKCLPAMAPAGMISEDPV
ncbi:hypothetical protein [Klebsiella sp. WOUb02]|uniref:hypothetical protein n=1 Tax=Klebsiella sp. WOUb02 TaxID=3161071 RepID=UPI003CF3E779